VRWEYISQNFIEDQIRKPNLFLDETKLDINYVPEELPHRDKELIALSQLFLILLTQPNLISRRVLITGIIGVGKTVTVKYFGRMILEAAEKREIKIRYLHINCRKERTGYKVLIKIMKSFENNFPNRGLSHQDIIDVLCDMLNRNNLHLVLVLDELNYLIGKNDDLIYTLTRINDESFNTAQRLSLIGIVRNISCLNNLDESTLSTLQRNIISFEKYDKKQIRDILRSRAKVSLKPRVFNSAILEMIAEIVQKKGDMRKSLELLWSSTKIAEAKELKAITPECVRLANNQIIPSNSLGFLKSIKTHKLVLIASILNILKKPDTFNTDISTIQDEYSHFCENIGSPPRSYSQIMNYLHELQNYGIISIKINSRNIKGRKSQISINDYSIKELETSLISILKGRGIYI